MQIARFSTGAIPKQAAAAAPNNVMGLYATALYGAALKKNALPAVQKDAELLSKTIKEVDPFSDLLKNPFIAKPDRLAALEKISKKMKLSETTTALLTKLADKNRSSKTAAILSTFLTMLEAGSGRMAGEIVSSRPLTDKEVASVQSQLKDVLKSKLGIDSNIDFALSTNPELVGGMLIKFGSFEIDLSTKTKLVTEINAAIDAAFEEVSTLQNELLSM
jgi:F-type H+-transporting ATPase subunit O